MSLRHRLFETGDTSGVSLPARHHACTVSVVRAVARQMFWRLVDLMITRCNATAVASVASARQRPGLGWLLGWAVIVCSQTELRTDTTSSAIRADGTSTSRPSGRPVKHLSPAERHEWMLAMHGVRATGDGGTRVFSNPHQRIRVSLAPDDTLVSGLDGAAVRFLTPSLGRRGTADFSLTAGTPATVHDQGRRVERERASSATNVTEWWSNHPSGIEQGFVVHTRPDGSGPLVVRQPYRSRLTASLTDDRHSVVFSDPAGERLQFADLKVWDASGRRLSAHFELDESAVATIVDEEDARYPVTIDPTWYQEAYLKASNADADDYFGFSVAISGDTMVVGAWAEGSAARGINADDSDNGAPQSGAAYVFVRSDNGWSQQAYLKASNAEAGDLFGWAVGISGQTIVVGTPAEGGSSTGVNGNQNSNAAGWAGAAYVFVRSGTTWSQQAYLKASNAEASDAFGSAVAISGGQIIVGAPNEDSSATGVNGSQTTNAATNSGAAYVFTRIGGVWTQSAYLKATNSEADDLFGQAVAITDDLAVVGAYGEDSRRASEGGGEGDNGAPQSGAAYVYARTAGQWTAQAYLKAPNADAGDWFGVSVGVGANTIVVGAPWEASRASGVDGDMLDNGRRESGAAYTFTRNGNAWAFQSYLKSVEPGIQHGFGWAVALDSETVLAGEFWAQDPFQAGAAVVFRRQGASWQFNRRLRSLQRGEGNRFGAAVAVSGTYVAIGAPEEDGTSRGVNGPAALTGRPQSGAAYAFSTSTVAVSPSQWAVAPSGGTQQVTLTLSAAGFPWTATASDDWLLVSPAAGMGSATITIAVGPTTTAQPRSATVSVAGETIRVTQAGPSAALTVSPLTWTASAGGDTQLLTVRSSLPDSPWTARSPVPWLRVSPEVSSGSGSVLVTALATTSSLARTATLDVAGQTIAVTQSGGAPNFTVTPSDWGIRARGGAQQVVLTSTLADAPWSASASAEWLTVSPSSGIGTATLTLAAAATTSARARTGEVVVAGRRIAVSQEAGQATWTLSQNTWAVAAAGGSRVLTVSSSLPDAPWSASSSAGWLTISPSSGFGNASITLAASSASQPRTATVTIAGQSVVVTQSAPPATFIVSPETWAPGADGGTRPFSVVASRADASWAVSYGVSWITATPTTSTGSSTVNLTAAANTSTLPRSALVFMAGQAIQVTQTARAATFALVPTAWTAMESGQSTAVNLTVSPADALWVVSVADPWISVSPVSGQGRAVLRVVAQPQAAWAQARTGGFSVGGQTFVVTQRARTAPFTPSQLTASVTRRRLRLTWSAPDAGPAPDSYLLEYGFSPGQSIGTPISIGPAQEWTMDDVPPGRFFIRVRASNAYGLSGSSNEVELAVGDSGLPPARPQALIGRVFDRSVRLTWNPPFQGEDVDGYQVEAGLSPGTRDAATVQVGRVLSFQADGVPPGRYYVRVRAHNRLGVSEPTDDIVLTVGGTGAPPPSPAGLRVITAGAAATFAWNHPEGTAVVTRYWLDAGRAPGLSDVASVDVGTATAFVVDAVPPGVYFVRVRAENSHGSSPPSNEVSVRHVPEGAPEPGSGSARHASSGRTGPEVASHFEPAEPGQIPLSGDVQAGTMVLQWGLPESSLWLTGYRIDVVRATDGRMVRSVHAGLIQGIAIASLPRGDYLVRVTALSGARSEAASRLLLLHVDATAGVSPPPTDAQGKPR